jgi:hypothetical protein
MPLCVQRIALHDAMANGIPPGPTSMERKGPVTRIPNLKEIERICTVCGAEWIYLGSNGFFTQEGWILKKQ